MRGRWLTSSAVFLVLSILGIVVGGILRWGADDPDAANLVWALTTVIGIIPIGWEVLSGILHRQPGVDLIAVLAMGGALALEEYLAGAVIAFMLATGRTLEDLPTLAPTGSSPRCSNARHAARTGTGTARSRRCRSGRCDRATCCS